MKINRYLGWDEHLVFRAQHGEAVAFEILADTYRDAMRQQAMRVLHDSDDANDAVQDALLKAYRAINGFQLGRPVLPWLLRICSNCSVDVLRSRRHACESLEKHEHSLQDGTIAVHEGAEAHMEEELVRDAVDRLPSRYRSIILMRHYRQMDVGEIASELNKPEGTIKSWLFRARALLKKELRVAMG